MADDNLDPVIEKDEPVVETPTLTPDEQRALDLGWKPKDKWEGDESEWVPAKWWLKYGDLEQRSITLEAETKKKDRVIGAMKDHYVRVKDDAKAEVLAQIKKAKAEAVKQEDYQKVAELDYQVDQINSGLDNRFNKRDQEVQKVDTENVGPAPEFLEWNRHNSWYKYGSTTDELTRYADTVAVGFRQLNPTASYEQMLEFAEESVKAKYPDKFKPMPNNPVNESGSNNQPKPPKGGSKTRLTEAEKEVARNFGMTEEEYAKELEVYSKRKGL